MSKRLSREEVINRLRAECQRSSQKAWAQRHGVSPQYVGDVLRGRLDPGPSILRALGLRRVVEYESQDAA